MTTTAYNIAATSYAGTPTRSLLRRIPLFVWNGALLAVVIGLSACYLFEINKTIAHGYQISEAQKKVSELQAQARVNQIKLSEMEAVGSLTAQAQALGMVPVGQVDYVLVQKSGVARK